jgi:hypothetical protein
MIRHVVVFRWKPEATEDQKARAAAEVARLPAIVPSILGFAIGADAGIDEGNAEFAVTADFEDEAGYLAYRNDPTHRAILAEHVRPILAERTAVQFRH